MDSRLECGRISACMTFFREVYNMQKAAKVALAYLHFSCLSGAQQLNHSNLSFIEHEEVQKRDQCGEKEFSRRLSGFSTF